MKKILSDTNAYSRFLSGDQKVLNVFKEARIVYMSVFVIGELIAGFRGGRKEEENREILRKFLAKRSVKILNATRNTADIFGKIKHDLKIAGTPLPINDIWIAAHAIETKSVLITYDSHFEEIAGLRLWEHLRNNEMTTSKGAIKP